MKQEITEERAVSENLSWMNKTLQGGVVKSKADCYVVSCAETMPISLTLEL